MKSLGFLLLFLFFSCQPSIVQLQKFEYTATLKNTGLQVPMYSAEEEIALLEKYEQNNKALKLVKKIEDQNNQLKQAFANEFSFCDVFFVAPNVLDKQKPWLRIIEEEINHDKRDLDRILFQIIQDGTIQIESAIEGSSPRVAFATKQLDRKLNLLYNKGNAVR